MSKRKAQEAKSCCTLAEGAPRSKDPKKIMNSLWSSEMPTQRLTLVLPNEDINDLRALNSTHLAKPP